MANEAGSADRDPEWPGITCLSWMWPHAGDGAHFEVRRAVASLTNGLRRSVDASFNLSEADVGDVLAFVDAANSITKAADATLREVVAEAISRGATWQQVAERLGIDTRQGAQNRFGKGISRLRKEAMPAEKVAASVLFRSMLDALPADVPVALDEEDWQAAPPEVAVPYAWRTLAGALLAFDHALGVELRGIPTDVEGTGKTFIKGLHESYEILRHCVGILSSPRAWEAMDSGAQELSQTSRMLGESPMPHFMHGACAANIAFANFSGFWQPALGGWNGGSTRRLAMARFYLEDALFATLRPECIEVVNNLESRALKNGHAVYRGFAKQLSGVDMEQFSEAYWKGDVKRLSELAGIAPESSREALKRRDIIDVLRKIEEAEE